MCAAYSEVTTLYCNFAKFRTPNILFLDSTLSRFDSTFWLDSTLKLNYIFLIEKSYALSIVGGMCSLVSGGR